LISTGKVSPGRIPLGTIISYDLSGVVSEDESVGTVKDEEVFSSCDNVNKLAFNILV
jgi:hypothetical protein